MHGKNGHPFKHALGADLGVNDVLEHKLLPAHQQGLVCQFNFRFNFRTGDNMGRGKREK